MVVVVWYPGGDNSLWVSGLTSAFRAADLKQLFGKFGKVCFEMWHCGIQAEALLQDELT